MCKVSEFFETAIVHAPSIDSAMHQFGKNHFIMDVKHRRQLKREINQELLTMKLSDKSDNEEVELLERLLHFASSAMTAFNLEHVQDYHIDEQGYYYNAT